MTRIKIEIQGMHCASCSSNIERSLKKISGVKNATISVMTKKGFVETEKEISEDELKKAVSRAGSYKLVSVEKA